MARIPLFKRTVVTILNVLFPPLAVLLLAGSPNADVLINSCLFLLAVIPSHVHGFYLSFTYFNRKRKVRQGVYPGKPHSFIHADRINNGGASRKEVARLKAEKEYGKLEKRSSRISKLSGLSSGQSSPISPNSTSSRVHSWNDGMADKYIESSTPISRQSTATRRAQDRERRRRRRTGYEHDAYVSGDDMEVSSRRSSRRCY